MAIEVIESKLSHSDEMIQRFPEYGTGEIKWGAQLTVTDGEWGVFFRDGKALEVFDSGRHVLTTQNIPVLTKFVTQFGYGPDSPFRSNVVFVSKTLFPDLKWGTADPIVFRDPEINFVRLRAFGSQSIRVKDPLLLLNNLVGRQGAFSTKKIESEQLKLDQKLIELYDLQLSEQNKEIKNSSKQNDEIDHTLALKVGDEIIRMKKNLYNMPDDTRGVRQLSKALQRIQDTFKVNGYEMVEMLNKPYVEGMKVVVNFITDENLEKGKQIITKIIKPQINFNGKMIQSAQIEVSVGQ